MSEIGKVNKTKKDDEIQWFGIDGVLCLLYVLEAVFIGTSLINNNDYIIGEVVPYGIAIVTILIFLRYIVQVITFSKSNAPKKS
ncbi:MAG: hypothetical protein LBJ36_07190 [Synergistaceae bacterium]|jgi:hypothetical protein|nr:hypothetical protein [Synergistaceae bacterium]